MRIGILTLPLHTNYGGILQAYALQTILERMGHQVVVFDTPKKKIYSSVYPILLALRKIPFAKGIIDSFMKQHQGLALRIISNKIHSFILKNIHQKIINSFAELQSEDYDAIIVGSDQVWRVPYFVRWQEQSIENAFLSFAHGWDIRRIAYAASFGTAEWEYNEFQTKKCREQLIAFNAVSLREHSGVELCKRYFRVEAQQVLDPTLLLTDVDYITLFKKNHTPKSKGTFLNYILDQTEEIQALIDEIAVRKHLIPFAVNNKYEYDNMKSLNERLKPSVEEWLRGFYDAKFIITDSFHACVFSIIFHKQFVVVGNKKRGMSRFISLLALFGLEDRLVDINLDINNLKEINYDEVNKRLDELKKKSIAFLCNSLT